MEAYNYGKPYGVGYYHKRNKDLVKYEDRVVELFVKTEKSPTEQNRLRIL